MYSITIKRQANGHVIETVTFESQRLYRITMNSIIRDNNLHRRSASKTQERYTSGDILVVGRACPDTPAQRIITAARRAIAGAL